MSYKIINRRIDYCLTGWDLISTDSLSELFSDLNLSVASPIFSPLHGGSLNKLFCTSFHGARNFVIKISPTWNNTGLARENWCYALLKSNTNLKIPRVYAYLPNDNLYLPGHEILVLEKINGRHLKESDLTNPTINSQLSSILNEIHKTNGTRYGWLFGPSNEAECESWLEFLCKLENIHLTLQRSQITTQEVDFLYSNFLEYGNWQFPSRLLYGDMNNSNLIVNDSDVIIPIDFQNCFYGDPLYDLGIMLFFNPSLLKYLNYYQVYNKQDIRKIILYAMRHCINTLGHRCSIQNIYGIHESETKYFLFKQLFEET